MLLYMFADRDNRSQLYVYIDAFLNFIELETLSAVGNA